ncbi:MAG: cysteine desulfurase [Ruminococcaceae bacterium]|nr:cysteine desulfurase [Oscillospiraceae bacterium]
MSEHYLDNSATTVTCEKAAQKALSMMTSEYGNPSSLHKKGLEAELELTHAREVIANSLFVESDEVYFTSGSTESNNTVLFGVSSAKKRNGNKIVTTAIEHSSVIEACKKLEQDGFEVVYLTPDKNGVVPPSAFEEAVDSNTILVAVMAVNNEVGSVQNLERIGKIIKRKNKDAVFHVDAVQAYGKMVLKPKKWGVDTLCVSSHKVHGPKGVGALYIKKGVRVLPLLFGGEQQKKQRPGTECAPLIASFATAVEEFDITKNREHINALNEYLVSELKKLSDITINSSIDAIPYVLNISVEGIKSETMLHHLEQDEVYVSSSSACAKGKKSYVLKAMGLSDDLIDSSLRISFSKYNDKADVDAFLESLKKGMNTLAKRK